MMTREQIDRASKLCGQRDDLIARAKALLHAKDVYFSISVMHRPCPQVAAAKRLDAFRTALKEERNAQLAVIDAELRALGVEPDPVSDDEDESDEHEQVAMPRPVEAMPRGSIRVG
jgi:hypothetical protein